MERVTTKNVLSLLFVLFFIIQIRSQHLGMGNIPNTEYTECLVYSLFNLADGGGGGAGPEITANCGADSINYDFVGTFDQWRSINPFIYRVSTINSMPYDFTVEGSTQFSSSSTVQNPDCFSNENQIIYIRLSSTGQHLGVFTTLVSISNLFLTIETTPYDIGPFGGSLGNIVEYFISDLSFHNGISISGDLNLISQVTCPTNCEGDFPDDNSAQVSLGYITCFANFANCNSNLGDGCESNLLSDNSNCGTCGTTCTLPHVAASACVGGICIIGACDSNFLNCNGMPADGCEINLLTDPNNCGNCGLACPSIPGSIGICSGGECSVECDQSHLDCDGLSSNGCESDSNSITTCGSCENNCNGLLPLSNVVGISCVNGFCEVSECENGYSDCNGVISDGCEVNIQSVTTCGDCNNNCVMLIINQNVNSVFCNSGECEITCDAGYGNCNGNLGDGCEIDISTDVSQCGSCSINCNILIGSENVASTECSNSQCSILLCDIGFGDCNGVFNDGCEVDLINSPFHCGQCELICNFGDVCSGGSCVIPSATPSISVTSTITPSISPSITSSISISPSITPSITPSISVTATITPSITPSISPSEIPSVTPTESPAISPTSSISLSPSRTTSLTPSISESAFISPSITPSITISPSITPSITPSISESPSITPSITPTISLSISPSISTSEFSSVSPTSSISLSPSRTPSLTPSISESASISPSITPSITISPSIIPSITPSISELPSITPSITPSISQSITPSISSSRSPSNSNLASNTPTETISLSISSSNSPTPNGTISSSFIPSPSFPSTSPSIFLSSPSLSLSSPSLPSPSIPSPSPSISSPSPSIPSPSPSLLPSLPPSTSQIPSSSTSTTALISPSCSSSETSLSSTSFSSSISPSHSSSLSQSLSQSSSLSRSMSFSITSSPSISASQSNYLLCDYPFANCDQKISNGCEIDLSSDPINCGECDQKCEEKEYFQNNCEEGKCEFSLCPLFFANCDLISENGCESSLSSPFSCNSCFNSCFAPNAQSICALISPSNQNNNTNNNNNINNINNYYYECVIEKCSIGYNDTDQIYSNGCEVKLNEEISDLLGPSPLNYINNINEDNNNNNNINNDNNSNEIINNNTNIINNENNNNNNEEGGKLPEELPIGLAGNNNNNEIGSLSLVVLKPSSNNSLLIFDYSSNSAVNNSNNNNNGVAVALITIPNNDVLSYDNYQTTAIFGVNNYLNNYENENDNTVNSDNNDKLISSAITLILIDENQNEIHQLSEPITICLFVNEEVNEKDEKEICLSYLTKEGKWKCQSSVTKLVQNLETYYCGTSDHCLFLNFF